MPQINRIRVNNVKYNFATQYYDDFLMRFSCRNSIYDLANGGGKSVLMLLLMQNMIPNCSLDDKQPLEKLFRDGNNNSVIHSLVEWRLDPGEERDGYKYMTTGFCARKAKEDDKEQTRSSASVEYFNYVIFYKAFGDNDIKNLPLTANGERITYNGLKAYLRSLDKSDLSAEVHIFEKKGDYQNFISDYGIYESQWEIIKGINKTEGHVRTYFETNYKTTRKVIEDLFIEEIIEKSYNNRIRKDSRDNEEMAQTLMDIKDKLIELSGRKSEIAGYDRQIELLNIFEGRLAELEEIYDRRGKAREKMVKLLGYCRRRLALKEKAVKDAEDETASFTIKLREVTRQIKQAQIEQELLALDKVLLEIKETQTSLELKDAEEQGYKKNLYMLENAADYSDYLEYKEKAAVLRELISSENVGEEELRKQLSAFVAAKYLLVKSRMATFAAENERLDKQIAEMAQQVETLRNGNMEVFGNIKAYDASAELYKSRYEEQSALLRDKMSEQQLFIADAIGEKADEVTSRLLELEEKYEKIKAQELEENARIEEINASLLAAKQELLALNAQESIMKEKLAETEGFEERLESVRKVYGASYGDDLQQVIKGVHDSLYTQYVRDKDELDALKDVRDSFEKHRMPGYDKYYLNLLEYLNTRYGDSVITGWDYIDSLEEDVRGKAVKTLAFLPYAVVVNDTEEAGTGNPGTDSTEAAGDIFEAIKNDTNLTSMNLGSYRIPIISAAKAREAVNDETPFEDGYGIGAVYAGRDISILWDDKILLGRLEIMAEEVAEKSNALMRLKDKCDVVSEDLVFAGSCVGKADSSAVKYELETLALKAAKSEKSRDLLLDELREKESILSELKEKEKVILSETETLEDTKAKLVKLTELKISCDEIGAKLSETQKLLANARRQYSDDTKLYDTNEKKLKELKQKKANSAAILKQIEEDFDNNWKQYYSPMIEPVEAESEEQLDIKMNAVRMQLLGNNGEAADKEKLLAEYDALMKKAVSNMSYRGMTLESAKEAYDSGELVKHSVEDMIVVKESIEKVGKEKKEIDTNLDRLGSMKNRIEGSIDYAMREYEEKYGEFLRLSDDEKAGAGTGMGDHIAALKQEELRIEDRIEEIKQHISELREESKEALIAQKDIERVMKISGMIVPEILAEGDLAETMSTEDYESAQKEFERINAQEKKAAATFEQSRKDMIADLERLGAYELAGEISSSIILPQSVSEIAELKSNIKETCDCIALERDSIGRGIEDMEKIRDSFENRCIQICANVRTELDRIEKMSRITLDDELVPIVTLQIPYIKDEMYKERMTIYINETIKIAEGYNTVEDKLKYIRSRLSWKKLFSVVVTDMNAIKLCLYKRERITDRSRYLKYEEAVGSTGQSQGIYIQFLIAVINYIAGVNAAGKDSTVNRKTIFIDNPFGAAKDVYIWEPIFKLLKTNHVQLIVPARGVTPAITAMFDVNYILGQTMIGDKLQTVVTNYRSQINAEEMDYERMDFKQTSLI